MGADIRGWVEIQRGRDAQWDAVIRIEDIVHRSYGMYASLFGVRNWSNRMLPHNVERVIPVGQFRAIAPSRGAPPNASPDYERDRYIGVVGETWVLWAELATIDWDEEGEQYVDDEPPYLVSAWPGLGRRHERRRDYLNGGWATLFKLMEELAEQFGSDNVRLCVWFNQW